MVSSEELRPVLWEYLRSNKNENLQEHSIKSGVVVILLKRGIIPAGPTGLDDSLRNPERSAGRETMEILRQMVWELVIQGILVPGWDNINDHWPFCKLTDYGKQVVDRGEILPYDPDGYLAFLKAEIPIIDPEIMQYVLESLHAYRYGLIFASAVTLGAASEKAFFLLHQSLTNALTDATKKQKFLDLQDSIKTKKKFDAVKAEIILNRSKLPGDLNDVLETNLDGIFTLIRVTRNEAGHPQGAKIKRENVFANLQLFIPYCKTLYELVNWFSSNKI